MFSNNHITTYAGKTKGSVRETKKATMVYLILRATAWTLWGRDGARAPVVRGAAGSQRGPGHRPFQTPFLPTHDPPDFSLRQLPLLSFMSYEVMQEKHGVPTAGCPHPDSRTSVWSWFLPELGLPWRSSSVDGVPEGGDLPDD